jgi:hypothetical protein
MSFPERSGWARRQCSATPITSIVLSLQNRDKPYNFSKAAALFIDAERAMRLSELAGKDIEAVATLALSFAEELAGVLGSMLAIHFESLSACLGAAARE